MHFAIFNSGTSFSIISVHIYISLFVGGMIIFFSRTLLSVLYTHAGCFMFICLVSHLISVVMSFLVWFLALGGFLQMVQKTKSSPFGERLKTP
jgi:hypothetical protein